MIKRASAEQLDEALDVSNPARGAAEWLSPSAR